MASLQGSTNRRNRSMDENCGNAAVRPRNEIELLQDQNEAQREKINQLETELLELYRRVHGADRPSDFYQRP